jgi:hypothetical protein
MATFVRTTLLAGLIILCSGSAALADITAGNLRPIVALPANSSDPLPPGSPLAGTNLQDVLNYIYGCDRCVDAKKGQDPASMWHPSTLPGVLSPTLVVEFAASTAAEFGMWSGKDLSTLIYAPIFNSVATGIEGGFPSSATLKWSTDGTKVKITGDASEGVIAPGALYNIPVGGFGFYVKSNGRTWFSDDELNTLGAPQMLAYLGGGSSSSAGAWTLAFEDSPFWTSEKDFNDFVVKIESMAAVPEPASILLFGTVLLALASVMRVRFVR